MSVDILGTSWDQCRSMVQYSCTSTETLLGRTAQDGHLDSHTAPELWGNAVFLFLFYIHTCVLPNGHWGWGWGVALNIVFWTVSFLLGGGWGGGLWVEWGVGVVNLYIVHNNTGVDCWVLLTVIEYIYNIYNYKQRRVFCTEQSGLIMHEFCVFIKSACT